MRDQTTIRRQVSTIGEAVEKRELYNRLFDLQPNTTEMCIKGEFSAVEAGIICEPVFVRTFRVVKRVKALRGVANGQAEVEVDGEDTWVTASLHNREPFDLLLREEV